MAIEYELKFRATPEAQEAIRQALSGPQQQYCMQTVYYDTPDGALSRRCYTLRRRMENDVAVCTLKAPAGQKGRAEFEVRCEDIRQAIPELCKLSGMAELSRLVQTGLVEVCGARFNRITRTVELGDTVVEVALDRGVLTGGGKEVPLCEVEVELKSGSTETTAIYAARLAAVYGLVPEKGSKFRRALALAKGE